MHSRKQLAAQYNERVDRMERKQFQLGDIVQMKKPHPCGSNEMEVIRMGMDIRIKCVGCKHSVLVPRAKFEKNMKKVLKSAAEETPLPE